MTQHKNCEIKGLCEKYRISSCPYPNKYHCKIRNSLESFIEEIIEKLKED